MNWRWDRMPFNAIHHAVEGLARSRTSSRVSGSVRRNSGFLGNPRAVAIIEETGRKAARVMRYAAIEAMTSIAGTVSQNRSRSLSRSFLNRRPSGPRP